MTTLDWILVGFIALMALSGWKRGLIGTVLSLAGLAIGAVVGARLAARYLTGSLETHYSALVALGGALIGAFVFQAIGGMIASFTRGGLRLLPPLRMLDSLGGLVLGALCGALLVWVRSRGAIRFQVPAEGARTGLPSRRCCGGSTGLPRRTTSCGSRLS